METRSKAQRDAEAADAQGSGFITGKGEAHPTCDPSLPILLPVGARATPVLMEESSSDAEQPLEHAGLPVRPEISTCAISKLKVVYCTCTSNSRKSDDRNMQTIGGRGLVFVEAGYHHRHHHHHHHHQTLVLFFFKSRSI